MARIRLDALLCRRELAPSREKAQHLILAGQVLVSERVVDKASALVEEDAPITVREGLPYVSRGGLKLAKAFEIWPLSAQGLAAADVGASTGGFTDCLLQHGAARVYAIDVGYGQLDWKLRQDARVVVMERTNARYLESLPEPVSLATIDASFISLRLLLPQVHKWLHPGGQVVALVKPQFEAGRELVGKGGVVRETRTHRVVLQGILRWATQEGWVLRGLARSPIKGPKGNVEFLVWLGVGPTEAAINIDEIIECVLFESSPDLATKSDHS